MFAQARDDTAVRGVATDEVSLRAVYEHRTRAYGVIGEHLARHRTGEYRHQAELVINPGEQRTDGGVRLPGEPSEQPSSTSRKLPGSGRCQVCGAFSFATMCTSIMRGVSRTFGAGA